MEEKDIQGGGGGEKEFGRYRKNREKIGKKTLD